MKRTPLEIISLKGDFCEIAFQLGKIRKKIIEKRVTFWNQLITKTFRGKMQRLRDLEIAFLREAQKQAPQYLEEIIAMSEGASIPFFDLFRLNLTELVPFADKCTTVITPFYKDGKRKILIAHNEDWDPKRNDVFILQAKTPKVSFTIVAYDGYLPGLSCGVNSHGFVHAINYVPPKDFRLGLPRIFITRHLVTAKSFNDMLDWIKKSKRAFGQSIHMAQKGHYLGIELSATKMALREIGLPTVHTNHYLEKKIFNFAAKPSENSVCRQQTAENILTKITENTNNKKLKKQEAIELATKILSDRSGYPYCLWREADTKKETSATLVTALLSTDLDKTRFFRQASEKSKPLTVSLNI